MANLQGLYLSRNRIGDVGMTEFSRAIASGSMAKLAFLNLPYKTGGKCMICMCISLIKRYKKGSLT